MIAVPAGLIPAALLVGAVLLGAPSRPEAGWGYPTVTVHRPARDSLPGVRRVALVRFRTGRHGFGRAFTDLFVTRLADAEPQTMEIVSPGQVDSVLKLGVEFPVLDDQGCARLGHLLGVDAVIAGEIDDSSRVSDEAGLTEVEKYRAADGAKYVARCSTIVRTGVLWVSLRVVRVRDGQVLAADRQVFRCGPEASVRDPDPNDSWIPRGCTTDLCRALHPDPFGAVLHTAGQFEGSLCQSAAVTLSHDFVPYVEQVQISWDNVIARDDVLGMAKAGRFVEAMHVLDRDADSTLASSEYRRGLHKSRDYFYDCGLMHELAGDLDGALAWYRKAVMAGMDGNKRLLEAIARVNAHMKTGATAPPPGPR